MAVRKGASVPKQRASVGRSTSRRSGAAPVDDYIARLPASVRPLIRRLRATVLSEAPEGEEVISYRIPAVRYHGLLVFYAAFKDHLSFFPGSYATRRRLARYIRPFDAGKGTLHFPLDRPLPLGLVRRIVRMRIAENKARARARSARSRR